METAVVMFSAFVAPAPDFSAFDPPAVVPSVVAPTPAPLIWQFVAEYTSPHHDLYRAWDGAGWRYEWRPKYGQEVGVAKPFFEGYRSTRVTAAPVATTNLPRSEAPGYRVATTPRVIYTLAPGAVLNGGTECGTLG